MATISYNLDIETSKGYKKILDLHNQANQLFAKGITLRLNNDFSRPLGKITGDVKQFDSSLDAATARVLAFTSTTSILYAVGSAMKRLAQDAVGVEDALARIQAVTLSSSSTMKSLGENLFKVANATGNSFYEVAKAAEEFSRQGLSTAESLKAVTAAANLARLSGTDLKDSIGGLVSIISTFSSQTLEYADVVNTLASVDAQFATSASGLVDGLKRVAGVAEQAGISMERTISLIASTKQLTGRSEAVISNGIKSIFTNLQTSPVQEALRAVGVETKDAAGNFRDLIEVLKDYQKISDTLSPQTRADTDLKIAGKYQINTLSGIKRSFEDSSGKSLFSKAEDAANPDADLTKKRVELLNSTTKTREQILQNNITKLGAGVGDQVIKPALDSTIEFFNKAIENLDKFSSRYSAVFKGLGDVFSGPALLSGLTAIISLAAKLGLEIGGVLKSLFDFNNQGKKNLELQNSINQAFQNGDRFLVNQVRSATTLIDRQQALNKLLQDYLNTSRAAKEFQFLDVGLVSSANSKRIRNKASGSVPSGFEAAFAREQIQIESGVGGASRNAKPLVKNLNLSGVTEPVVVNSEEVIVRNFLGTGRDSVLNRSMIKRIGKGRLGQLGDVENLAIGKTPLPSSNLSFYGPDITPSDAKNVLKSIQDLRDKIAKNPGSVPYEQRAGINRALDAFSRQAGSTRFGNIVSQSSPSANPSNRFFNKVDNRAEIVALNNRINAEISATAAIKASKVQKLEEIRVAKQAKLEQDINRKISIDKSAGIITSAKDIRDITNAQNGVSRGPTSIDSSKFVNKALENEAKRFYKELDFRANKFAEKGKTFGNVEIGKAYKSYSGFTGSASERKEFLGPVVQQFKDQVSQLYSQQRRDRRENAPARAELQLNKEIENARKTKLGFEYSKLSNNDIERRVSALSQKYNLDPKQASQFNTYKEQIFAQRAQQSASRSQGALFAGSFAIPFLTGALSKGFEEKFTDASGQQRSRETKNSRFVSDIGQSASVGLTTAFIAKQLIGKLAAPVAIATTAYQLFKSLDARLNKGGDISKQDNAVKSERDKNKLDSLTNYLSLKSELENSNGDLSKNKVLKSKLKEVSASLSPQDIKELNSLNQENSGDYLIRKKDEVLSASSGRNFSDNITSIFEKSSESISALQKIKEVTLNASKELSGGSIDGYRYDKSSLDIAGLKDQLAQLSNNINYSALSEGKLSQISKTSSFGTLKSIFGDENLGISSAIPGLSQILDKSTVEEQKKLLKSFKNSIKEGADAYKNAPSSAKAEETRLYDIKSAIKSITENIINSSLNSNKRSSLLSIGNQEYSNKIDVLKEKGLLSESSQNISSYQQKYKDRLSEYAKESDSIKNELTTSIFNLISEKSNGQDKGGLLDVLKNYGVDGLIGNTGQGQTNYNALTRSLDGSGRKDLSNIFLKYNQDKQNLSISSAAKGISDINELKQSNELLSIRKSSLDRSRAFGALGDPLNYDGNLVAKTAIDGTSLSLSSNRRNRFLESSDRRRDNLGSGGNGFYVDRRATFEEQDSIISEEGRIARDKLKSLKYKIDTNPYLTSPEKIAETRGSLRENLSLSYTSQLKDRTLSSVGETIRGIDQYQRSSPGENFILNQEQRYALGGKIKTGDYEGSLGIIRQEKAKLDEVDGFGNSVFKDKNKRDNLRKYLTQAEEDIQGAVYTSKAIPTQSKEEADKIISKEDLQGLSSEAIKGLNTTLANLTAFLSSKSSVSSTGVDNEPSVIRVDVNAVAMSAEFQEKIRLLVQSEATRIVGANQGSPPVIPPAAKK